MGGQKSKNIPTNHVKNILKYFQNHPKIDPKIDPQTLPKGPQNPSQDGVGKKSPNWLQNVPKKAALGGPKGPPKSTIFDSFFKRFLGGLLEPSKTASERIWEPFWLHVGSIFGAVLAPKWGVAEKVKIELSSKRELHF